MDCSGQQNIPEGPKQKNLIIWDLCYYVGGPLSNFTFGQILLIKIMFHLQFASC